MSQPARVLVSVVLLLGALVAVQFRGASEAVQVRKPFNTFPATLGTWKGQEDTILEPDVLNMLKMSDYLMRRYVDVDGRSVWLYIGYWQSQRKGGGDIHSPKNCLPAGGWEPVEAARLSVAVPGLPTPISVNRYLIQKDNQMQVTLYWFQTQGKVISGELAAKIELVRNALLRNRTDGALVRLSSPVQGSVEQTTARLIVYVQALYPVLHEYLPD
ncbi:MAG TPA: EpsI family protein [Methylomirabilota bacterium]|nr:EpsI family protein [Methylomirabilota bacterium]